MMEIVPLADCQVPGDARSRPHGNIDIINHACHYYLWRRQASPTFMLVPGGNGTCQVCQVTDVNLIMVNGYINIGELPGAYGVTMVITWRNGRYWRWPCLGALAYNLASVKCVP